MNTNSQTKSNFYNLERVQRTKKQNVQQDRRKDDALAVSERQSASATPIQTHLKVLQRAIGNQALQRYQSIQRDNGKSGTSTGTEQGSLPKMDSRFQSYLNDMGRLFVEGVTSNVHPGLLLRLGGALALAGRDASWIRTEKDAALGFLDMKRNQSDVQSIAIAQWQKHRNQIEKAIAKGMSPAKAVERHIHVRTGRFPHSPQQVQQMLQPSMGPIGTYSAWLYDIVLFRRRFERGSGIMTGNSITSIATFAYFLATAEDWEKGRPEEWDRAFNFGENVVTPIVDVLDGITGDIESRREHRPSGSTNRPRRARPGR